MKWLKRAEQTHEYHVSRLRTRDKWTIKDTARELRRSEGGVVEDLMLYQYSKIYPKQLERCKSIKSALEFIRAKKKELALI